MTDTALETSSSDETRSIRRPGVWQRFKRWLLGPVRTDAPGRYIPRSPGSTFTTPSMGDAYDFTVRIRWVWIGSHWDDDTLGASVEPLKADVWEQLAVATRCTLRQFPPHLPAEAEAKLNCTFDEIMRTGQVSGASADWKARAEVSAHEEIRAQQQQAWTRYLGWANDQEMAHRIVDDYGVMTAKWRELLAKVGIGELDGPPPGFIGRDLIKLAADPAAAAIVVDSLSERRELKDRELLDTVAGAVLAHDNLNLLEADTAYDTALRRLMDWAGLPLPEQVERSFQDEDFR